MEDFFDYDIAQQRIEERRKKRNRFLVWICVTLLLLVSSLVSENPETRYLFPVAIAAAYLTGLRGIEVYFTAPNRAPNKETLEQQMEWLFGSEWRETAGVKEYSFAQDRIRKRRVQKWSFLLHLLVFVPALIVWILYESFSGYSFAGESLFVIVVWSIFIILRAISVLVSNYDLPVRERRVGHELKQELENLQPEKAKNEQKPKRQYAIGDDGELVELDSNPTEPEEKPKRDFNR